MPIYEYRCSACDHLAEVIHGINDPGPRFCESCGSEGTMRKGFGMPAVLYKGSGWARKDRPSRPSTSSGRSDRSSSDGSGGDGSQANGSSEKSEGDRTSAGSGPGSSSESGSRSRSSGSSSAADD